MQREQESGVRQNVLRPKIGLALQREQHSGVPQNGGLGLGAGATRGSPLLALEMG